VVDAAMLVLERMGLTPADLLAAPAARPPAPTFAEYIPVVSALVSEGCRRAYGSYWNRVTGQWGSRRIDEPTPSEIRQLVQHVRANVVPRRNSRGGRSAAEHLIAALRCMYKHAEEDSLIDPADNPARKVDKPRRLPSTRRAVADKRLAEINHAAATTGDDPELDTLLLRLHTETACRRGGALALRPQDLDPEQCLILLREKGETVRWQPVSPTLMAALLGHAGERHASITLPVGVEAYAAYALPNPSRIQVRAWVERPPGSVSSDGITRVTVGLTDPRSGASIAAKTLAAGSLDDAAAAVAGYVARHIFARDRTVPPWSTSATDGADLAALLLARQVRGYPECRSDIRSAWDRQIEILEGVAGRDLRAGVVRYELAQLHELCAIRRPVEALLLHAANREQYPRFYRGRYRLAMSLEMLANPHFRTDEIDMTTLKEALQILDRCGVTNAAADRIGEDQTGLPGWLRSCLLDAAWQELRAIHRYLTRRHIIWASFWFRNERAVLRPYRQSRHRQAFHDGVSVALLLVAVRQAQLPGAKTGGKLHHAGTIARITAAISGDSTDFAKVPHYLPARTTQRQPVTTRMRTRRWGWQCSTPSWPAAYNLACAYAALAASADPETELDPLVRKVVRSLEFAICNPECEMERPSEWISHPDFDWLRRAGNERFMAFLDNQRKRDYPADDQPTQVGDRIASPQAAVIAIHDPQESLTATTDSQE
jgi:hypothetical protein